MDRCIRTVLTVAVAIGLGSVSPSPAGAAESIVQVAEDSALTRQLETPANPRLAAPVNQICEPGAQWMRLRFKSLDLAGYDALTLRSSGGDSYTLEGSAYRGREFSIRALRGDCVTIERSFRSTDSRFQIDGYQFGTLPLGDTTAIVAGAGDICDSADCSRTASLITAINPVAVFTAGDNAYSDGTLAQYNSFYNTYWGPFKSYTKPTPGNHEYNTSGASGYFDYFNGVGNNNGIAGERGKGYYSWDVGDWHFIALNSNISMSAGSAQETWLRNDLAANTKPCTAAVWHHPLISRGNYTGVSGVKPLWNALYDYKADLVLVGHDHNYQRYAKANPSLVAASDGIAQILIGSGGRGFYALNGTHTLLQRANDDTYGVLKLTLSSTGYRADFVPVAGSTFTDTTSATCNNATGGNPDFSVAANPDSASVAPGSTATSTVNVTSIAGFTAPVTLTASGLPAGVTASFSPTSVTPPANGSVASTLTFTAAGNAAPASATVTIAGNSSALTHSGTLQLTVLPSGTVEGTAYALQLNGSGIPLVSLTLGSPGVVTSHGATSPQLRAYAGDFVGNDFSKLYAIDREANQLVTVTVPGNVRTTVGTSTIPPGSSARWAAASWSHKAQKLYVISANSSGTATPTLGAVNLATGAVTTVATISGAMNPVAMAVHPDGRIFIADASQDKILRINPTTGAATALPQGLGVNLSDYQDMDFDDSTGTLYMATWMGSANGGGEIRRVDLTTGTSVSLGHIGSTGNHLQLDAFSIAKPSDFLFTDGFNP
ncbi:metallophosphoesterase [Tahibacter amnicola]|uniref:Metallophosphoesterase n=1 Tax=Tahibacter amnicola TaxID=2976241 RepID=A0ABY6BLF1_9GAMM|nr:metallophosphoesterase [Tahibacter amnicola]UXI70456.1 metallophosphoesterase [Tahibacter amnicola]